MSEITTTMSDLSPQGAAKQDVQEIVAVQLRDWLRSMGYRPKSEGGDGFNYRWYEQTLLKGGITNQLMKVCIDRNQLETDAALLSTGEGHDVLLLSEQLLLPHFCVVVRLFGQNTDLVIDRAQVKLVEEHLKHSEITKEVYYRFVEGQIEEWLTGRSMEEEDIMRQAQGIASLLGALHTVPISKRTFCCEGKSVVWPSIEKFFSAALQERLQLCGALSLMDLTPLKDMVGKVRKVCDAQQSPLVLGHGDLLAGNILKLDNGDIRFIDFEYAGVMERGFDIANHFCEYAGFDCNYATHFPSQEEQRHFLRCYVRKTEDGTSVDDLLAEVQPFFLASHLLWGTFGLFQSVNSTIDFDFFSYGVRRLSALFEPESLDVLGLD
eukprot:GHVS01026531.1.p1 GENE.GHVS01026531.1~~GHVS01026531.1.p1  ORF type:complete len:379 (+),score=47.24 GHVS01026531.1:182-1318(+)